MDVQSGPETFSGECRDLVELVIDYLEGTLAPAVRRDVDDHLAECPDCVEYLDQFRTVVSTLGSLAEQDISPVARQRLTDAFRNILGGSAKDGTE